MDSKKRSFAKAITWRITGTLSVLVISYIITKEPLKSGSIATVHALVNIFLYYMHERVWNKIKVFNEGN